MKILDKNDEYSLFLRSNSNGALYLASYGDNSGPLSSGYDDDRWHHFVGIFDELNGEYRLYADGQELSDSPVASGYYSPDSSNNLYIAGDSISQNGGNFVGNVDEVRIYNKKLSNSEILDLYYEGYQKLYVSFDKSGNSIKTQGDTISGYTWQSKHEPSTDFHNGAETRFDTNANDPHFKEYKRATSDTGFHPSNSVSGDDRYYIRKLANDEADRFTLYLNDQVDPQKLKTQLFTQ